MTHIVYSVVVHGWLATTCFAMLACGDDGGDPVDAAPEADTAPVDASTATDAAATPDATDPADADTTCWSIPAGLYEGGTSARTLPGYAIGQTFTALASGQLARIDMGFFNELDGDGTLELHEGEGGDGPVLHSGPVAVQSSGTGALAMNEWPVDVAVVSGQVYTFLLWPNAATLPDPYGVAINNDLYAGGSQVIVDPSGTYFPDFDLVFEVHASAPCSP